jgi:hypothetical protein
MIEWTYKSYISITGSPTGSVADYPIGVITVHYGSGTNHSELNGLESHIYLDGHCRTDFGDIRFTNSANELRDYFMVEKVDGDYAKFWFKVTLSQDENNKHWIWFGNPTATYDGLAESTFFYVKDYVSAVGVAGNYGNRAYYSEMSKVQGPPYLSKLMWFKMSCLHQLGSSGNGFKIISYERVGTTKWHTRYKSAAFTLIDGTGVKYDLTPDGLNLDMFCDASDYIGYYSPSNGLYARTICNLDPASYATTAGEPTVCTEVTENLYTGGWWINCGGCFRKYISPEPTFIISLIYVECVLPTVETNDASNILTASATLNGEIKHNGLLFDIISNGGFEDGDLTGWEYAQAEVTEQYAHSGTFSVLLYENWIKQTFSSPIPKSAISIFTFWGTGQSSYNYCKVHLSDNTDIIVYFPTGSDWTEVDVLAQIPDGKAVSYVLFYGGTGGPSWVDDVTLVAIFEEYDERGFEWGIESGVYTEEWTETDTFGYGIFNHALTGLVSGGTYYYRAKGHNEEGWGYGEEKVFTTLTYSLVARVHSVLVKNTYLKGVKSAKWNDSNPWVDTNIPFGNMWHTHIKSPMIEGMITCYDVDSIWTAFYGGESPIIDENTGEKTKFSTSGDEFIITLKDVNGLSMVFNFWDVRITTIELQSAEEEGGGEGIWVIRFTARKVVKN